MKKYEFLENIAIADVAFDAYGKTPTEVFQNSALALFDIMCTLNKIKHKVKKEITLESTSLKQLLYDFLEELIFIKDTEQVLFSQFHVTLTGETKLTAVAHGDYIKHIPAEELRNDAKAITLHQYELKQEKTGWRARVIVDI